MTTPRSNRQRRNLGTAMRFEGGQEVYNNETSYSPAESIDYHGLQAEAVTALVEHVM